MATEQIMATWERDANERAAAALATLTERFDLDIPAEQPERLDARMRQIRVLQRHTVILEALAAATTNAQAPTQTPSGALAWVTGEIASRPAGTGVEDRHDLVEGVNALGALLGLEVREPMELSPEELAKLQAQLKEAEADAKKAKAK